MPKNRPSEAVHFRIAPLTGPAAKEELLEGTWHTEFWLACIATWAIYGVPIDGNRGFGAVCHKQYVGKHRHVVKAQVAADGRCSYWR